MAEGGFGYAKRRNSSGTTSGTYSGSSSSSGNYSSGNVTSRLGPASYVNNVTGENYSYTPSGSSKKSNSLEAILAAQLKSQQESLAAQKTREESALRSAQDAQRTAVDNSYGQSRSNITSQTEEALRQAYINSKLQERDFPQQASIWGEGGFAESTLASLRNQAQENRNQLELARSSQLGALESDYNTQLAGIESAGISQLANIGNTYSSALANAENSYQNNLYGLLAQQADREYEKELAAIEAANKSSPAPKTTSLNDLYKTRDWYEANGDFASADAIQQQINTQLGVTLPSLGIDTASDKYLKEVQEQLKMFGTYEAAANYIARLYNEGAITDREANYLKSLMR